MEMQRREKEEEEEKQRQQQDVSEVKMENVDVNETEMVHISIFLSIAAILVSFRRCHTTYVVRSFIFQLDLFFFACVPLDFFVVGFDFSLHLIFFNFYFSTLPPSAANV